MASTHPKSHEVAVLSLNALQKIEKIATDSHAQQQTVILSLDKANVINNSIKNVLLKQNKILEEIRDGIVVGNKKKDSKIYAIGNMSLEKIKNAAGLVGLLGFSILTLSIAYKMAGTVSPADIGKGLLVILSMVPILKVFGDLIQAKGKLFGDTMGIFRFMKSSTMLVATIVTLGFILSKLPNVGPGVLLTAVALAGVYYIIGTVYVKLIQAFRFGGIISFLLNRKTGDEAQHAMMQTAFTLVVIAGAMRLAPTLTPSQAISFVIAAFTLVPLATALVGLRVAGSFIKDMEYKDLLKLGVAVTALGLALIPIAFAAKMVDKVGITEKQLKNLLSLTEALAPLVVMIGFLTAIVGLATEKQATKREFGATSTLLQRDNSRKRNIEMDKENIKNFRTKAPLVIGAVLLAAIVFVASAGLMAAGARAARQIDMIGILKMGVTLAIFALIVGGFVNILRGKGATSEKSSTRASKAGFFGNKSSSTAQGEIKKNDLIAAALAIPLIALGIVAAAWIFQALPTEQIAPDAMFSLKAGFSLLAFSLPFFIISRAVKGMGLKEMLFMAIAIPVLALGVLATAWIFQGLEGINYEAPEPMWNIEAAISLVVFGAVVYLSSKTIGKLKASEMIDGLLGVVVSAFAILAVAWIFSWLPPDLKLVEAEWAIAAAVAIGAMGGVIVGIGFAIEKMGPQALLYGALGVIVIAIVMVAVGWILSALEGAMPALKVVAEGFVDILMAPVNGIIDAFARFKNEIGIENLIPLAIGVAALGGAWLIFSAAVAGGNVAGLLGSVAGAFGAVADGIGKLFGGKKVSPLDILEKLATIAPKIQTLAKPLTDVGVGFATINKSAGGVSKAFESVSTFANDTDVNDMAKNSASLRSIAGSYTGIANASKIMNIKAIETTTNMFKALTDLAKNNGQSAMAVLADKLLAAVKELTAAAGNLEKSVATQGDNTSASADLITKSLDKAKETITGVKREVGKMTADAKGVMDMQPLIDAITKLEDRFDTFIKVKVVKEDTFFY
jgi:uncharacterized BrkB/YihY/UPF0761 family membrane protein